MDEKDISILEIGDYVCICYHTTPQKLDIATIKEIDKVKQIAILNVKGSDIKIDSADKWRMLINVPIVACCLEKIGFIPIPNHYAFGTTAIEWVLNKPNQTWTLKHNNDASWTLILEEIVNGESQPCRELNNIGWLYQVQHVLNNPQLMSVKTF